MEDKLWIGYFTGLLESKIERVKQEIEEIKNSDFANRNDPDYLEPWAEYNGMLQAYEEMLLNVLGKELEEKEKK